MKRNNDELMLFSGTANLPLAKKVAKYLKRPLNKIDIKHFPDGETFCQVQEGVRGRDVFVIQSGSPTPNEAYMELFVIMDALKRGSAARITAVIPYYGYARQDRKDQPRVPITARLVANLLQCAGADRVLAMSRDGLTEYLGNYDYYLEKQVSDDASPLAQKSPKKEKQPNEWQLRKQRESEERKRKTKITRTEAQIEQLEGEIEDLQTALAKEEVQSDYEQLMTLSQELEEKQTELEALYDLWAELQE